MKPEEIKRAQQISGEVRMSLQDYHELIASGTKMSMMADKYEQSIESVKKFLTFMRSNTEINFDAVIREFNKENPDLTMYVDSTGKVGINLNLTRE